MSTHDQVSKASFAYFLLTYLLLSSRVDEVNLFYMNASNFDYLCRTAIVNGSDADRFAVAACGYVAYKLGTLGGEGGAGRTDVGSSMLIARLPFVTVARLARRTLRFCSTFLI